MPINNYIKKALRKGFTPDEIEEKLIENDYPKDVAHNLVESNKSKLHLEKGYIKLVWLILCLFLLILSSLFVISILNKSKDCGFDKACFIKKANNCEEATVLTDIEGTLFRLTTDNDCTFIKKIEEFSNDESQEAIDLMNNKEMICSYEEGKFSEDNLNTITGNIENCDGPLKDAIYDLMIALYMDEI